jgi:hypothetical protein
MPLATPIAQALGLVAARAVALIVEVVDLLEVELHRHQALTPAVPRLAGAISGRGDHSSSSGSGRSFASLTNSLVFRSRFGAFVSAGKIPFPGNRD